MAERARTHLCTDSLKRRARLWACMNTIRAGLKICSAQKTRIGKFLGEFFSENLSVRKFVLTCNAIHARKCKLKFVCRSPGGKTAPGFSLRGRGTPKNARGGAEHACCCACYVPVRGRRNLLFVNPSK